MTELKFRTNISKCSFKRASIDNNSTASIVRLTIMDEDGDDVDYEISLEYCQMDDLINLCREIGK